MASVAARIGRGGSSRRLSAPPASAPRVVQAPTAAQAGRPAQVVARHHRPEHLRRRDHQRVEQRHQLP
ncbi:hypothetical protein C3Y87_00235 [Carbonactinospora thermoautotrophica]|nr:hypothetical protein [Carbonactinospora thermoautotrophica]